MLKRRFVYPADFTPQPSGEILVTFPDIASAVTDGNDESDAVWQAADCLAEAIAGCIVDGLDIPPPSRRRAGQRLVAVPPSIAAKAALYLAMRDVGVTKAELARRLRLEHKAVRRMLDPRLQTKLPRVDDALWALGYRLSLDLDATDAGEARDGSAAATSTRAAE